MTPEVLAVITKRPDGQYVVAVSDRAGRELQGKAWLYVSDAIAEASKLARQLIPGAIGGAAWREDGVWHRRFGEPFVDPAEDAPRIRGRPRLDPQRTVDEQRKLATEIRKAVFGLSVRCLGCGNMFHTLRASSVACSGTCRQRVLRRRKPARPRAGTQPEADGPSA